MTASTSVRRTALGALSIVAGAMLVAPVQAQNYPISGGQRATAQQVSDRGVPLTELAPTAPDRYTVKRGDTLWGISGMYLLRPYRWPELWGMNLKAIPNPHLIYPGQTLYLDREGGYARLRTSPPGVSETVRISPRTRTDSLLGTALPTLKPHLIEPFLTEPVVVDASVLERAPRIVATTEERVLMADGDRAYARGIDTAPLRVAPGEQRYYRVYRNPVPLKDPVSGDILGYEAQFLGKAELIRGETTEDVPDGKGGFTRDKVPATVDLSGTKEEIRAGDRLLAEPGRGFVNYTPRAPQRAVDARVVSIYGGSAVSYAAQNQVVSINMGARDGIEPGHVLSLLSSGARIKDTTSDAREMIKLPSEANGMAMVFRTFDRVSYVLILDVRGGVRVGDRLVNPE